MGAMVPRLRRARLVKIVDSDPGASQINIVSPFSFSWSIVDCDLKPAAVKVRPRRLCEGAGSASPTTDFTSRDTSITR